MSEAPPLKPIGTLSRVLVGLFLVGILADAAAIVAEAGYLRVLNDLAAGVDLIAAEVQDAEDRTGLAAIAQLIVYALVTIVFVVWFRRAYRNLPALGAGLLRFRMGWATWAWFVPILNLFRPKQIANDLWRASGPDRVDGVATGWKSRPVAGIVHWWWAAFLISTWLGNRPTVGLFRAETVSEQQSVSQMTIVGHAASIVAAVVAVLFVRALTRRQQARIQAVSMPDDVPAAVATADDVR